MPKLKTGAAADGSQIALRYMTNDDRRNIATIEKYLMDRDRVSDCNFVTNTSIIRFALAAGAEEIKRRIKRGKREVC